MPYVHAVALNALWNMKSKFQNLKLQLSIVWDAKVTSSWPYNVPKTSTGRYAIYIHKGFPGTEIFYYLICILPEFRR